MHFVEYSVCHRQTGLVRWLKPRASSGEFGNGTGCATEAIETRDGGALNHETRNYAMEGSALVVQWAARATNASSAQTK